MTGARTVQLERLNSRLALHFFLIDFQARDAAAREHLTTFTEQFDGLQEIVGHHGAS